MAGPAAAAANLQAVGQGAGGAGQGFSSFTQGLQNLFGTSGSVSGTQTEQLEVSQEAINKIIKDILSSTQGLAGIFNEENVSGLFSSSVAAQASGDLLANLAGEIAKLTSKKVTTNTQSTEDEGALGGIESVFSSVGNEVKRLGRKLGF